MVDRGGAAGSQGGAPGVGRGAKIEVVGLSKENVEEIFWDAVRHGPSWPESRRNNFRHFVRWTESNGNSYWTLPPLSVMMAPWTDTNWNGSATTS